MKKTLNIAVTGLNAIDSPGPGVPVIRALHEAGSFDVRIIGLAYESLEPGIYMHDLVDRTYQIPYPTAGVEALMARLEYIHEKEKLDAIIPNFDAELFTFIRLEPRLKRLGIHMFLPTEEQFEARQKTNLQTFGKKHKIKVPKDKSVNTLHDLPSALKEFNFPVVVKGRFYDAIVAHNADQARSAFGKISSKWGVPVILQEFIDGIELNVTGLGDGKGNMIAAVPMRKQYITDKGKAWGGITIDDPKILGMTERFIQGTHWRGGFELELMRTKSGDIHLLEINPRMPAWIYFAVGVGQNIPEVLVNLSLGKPVKPLTEYAVGKMFIRYSWDMIVDREEFETISMTGEL